MENSQLHIHALFLSLTFDRWHCSFLFFPLESQKTENEVLQLQTFWFFSSSAMKQRLLKEQDPLWPQQNMCSSLHSTAAHGKAQLSPLSSSAVLHLLCSSCLHVLLFPLLNLWFSPQCTVLVLLGKTLTLLWAHAWYLASSCQMQQNLLNLYGSHCYLPWVQQNDRKAPGGLVLLGVRLWEFCLEL